MDPRVISLDIETYGIWHSLPEQTCFTPRRSVHVDGVPRSDLVLTCSITIPKEDPRCTDSSATSATRPAWTRRSVAALVPGETMVLTLKDPRKGSTNRSGLRLLRRWLHWADTILGANLLFDIAYLRAIDPGLRALLDGRHTLIDLIYVNFLQSDVRPERSLKTLGPILNTHTYKETIKQKRFNDWASLLSYNAQDTHNTILAISALASRIPPDSDKLSPFSIHFYSDTIWSCIHMSENGVPMSRSSLETMHSRLQDAEKSMERHFRRRHGLLISKKSAGGRTGCEQSKQDFFSEVINDIGPHVLDDSRLQKTPIQGRISFNEANRVFLQQQLSPSSPLYRPLALIGSYLHTQKLFSTYCCNYLYGRRNKPADRTSILVPQVSRNGINPDVWLSHPVWYIVPSAFKDDQGDEGGTRQGRIVCKKGAHLTDPPSIQAAYRSRWPGGIILTIDLSQIELRVAALLSGDPSMLQAYQDDEDLHSQRAVAIWGNRHLTELYGEDFLRNGTFRTRERQIGKTVNFADLYRSGAPKLRSTVFTKSGLDMPLSFFEDVVRNRSLQRPGLYAWQESLISEARATGKIELPFTGQSRFFEGGSKFDENEIVNFPVQTTAGNVLLRIQAYLYHLLKDRPTIRLFLNVFDALRFDCRLEGDVTLVREGMDRAIEWVSTHDYWYMLQQHTGRTVPLQYELKH